MKKILIFCLTVFLTLTLALPAGAAEADTAPFLGKVKISSGVLNVRSSGSKTGKIIYSLKKDSYVTLIKKSGDWWQVQYGDGKYGYCSADYITKLQSSKKTVKLSSGTLNVRSGASTKHGIIGSLKNGTKVIVISENAGWSRILFNGTKTGYVSGKYLLSAGQNSGAIALAVPNFKQTDSRWKDVKIGNSGKTIAQIGCATTGIAMMESFRQGKTIYPDAMSKSLNYTPSGNVYWPSNFTVITKNEGYLGEILNILKVGKPVLLGQKNSFGSQHWVVITGFKGGAVTADNFTINDPGSSTRKTLSDFLAKYPIFYKYFVYK